METFPKYLSKADISSDASGRAYAGVIDFPNGPFKIIAGEFDGAMLQEDIQVKEGEALRATLQLLIEEFPT